MRVFRNDISSWETHVKKVYESQFVRKFIVFPAGSSGGPKVIKVVIIIGWAKHNLIQILRRRPDSPFLEDESHHVYNNTGKLHHTEAQHREEHKGMDYNQEQWVENEQSN